MSADRGSANLIAANLLVLCMVFSMSVSAHASPEETASDDVELNADHLIIEQIEPTSEDTHNAEGNWADSSHQYIGTKADDLAIYLDRFFGTPLEDLESADSTVRLATRFDWDEDDGSDSGVSLRGTVHLPRVSKRLSLVFDGDDSDNENELGVEGNKSSSVGLQLNAKDGKRSRFDITLRLSSGPNLKPGVRYRYKEDLSDWGRFRYTAKVDYSDSELFRHRHGIELDYLTGDSSLLRWANKVEQGQRSEGLQWSSLVSWRYGYSIDSAVSFTAGVVGKTEPEIPDYIRQNPPYIGEPPKQSGLLTNYIAALRFRNRLYKDWRYMEIEPGYTQRQRHHFEDRHGVFFARVSFEVLFNRGREQFGSSSGGSEYSASKVHDDGND